MVLQSFWFAKSAMVDKGVALVCGYVELALFALPGPGIVIMTLTGGLYTHGGRLNELMPR